MGEAEEVEDGLGGAPFGRKDGWGRGVAGAVEVAVRGEMADAATEGEKAEVGFEAALEAGEGGVVGEKGAEGAAGVGDLASKGGGRGEGGGGRGGGKEPSDGDFGGQLEPLSEVGGEAPVAGGGAVGDGGGGVFQPFFEAAATGNEVAASVGADLVEGGGGGFNGEELVAEQQGGGGSAGGAGDLPGGCDVGGGGGAGFCGVFGGVAEVDVAVEAGFGGDDAFRGQSDAVANGEVERGGGHEERLKAGIDVEAVVWGGGVHGEDDGGKGGKRQTKNEYFIVFSLKLTKWWGRGKAKRPGLPDNLVSRRFASTSAPTRVCHRARGNSGIARAERGMICFPGGSG